MTATTNRAPRRRFPAWAALLWGLLVFVCLQVALDLALEFSPNLRDPEYAVKLGYLHEQLAENPGKRLVLLMGNSRPEMGFRPEVLPSLRSARGEEVVVFNYALIGCGPVLQRICLDRLLADGIRPDWLIVECWAPNWRQEGNLAEDHRINIDRLNWNDACLLERFAVQRRRVVRTWREQRALPWYSLRYTLLDLVAPDWLPSEVSRQNRSRLVDHTGWRPNPFDGSPAADLERQTAQGLAEYKKRLSQFHHADSADRALREILDLGRRERIGVALLYMPESSAFRNLYSPALWQQVERYLKGLSDEYQVPLIDARLWMADESFSDGFHLLPEGAATFTERFGREALPHLLGE